MTAPKCEDCRWGKLPGCSNPNVSAMRFERARAPNSECGPEGELFQPKEGKRDE